MSMDEKNGQEQYSFLEEKIKNDTFDKKKMLYKNLKIAGRGLIFGIAASIGFFALKPWAETAFHQNPDEITIPKDEEKDENKEQVEIADTTQQVLTIDNYKELNHILGQVASEAQKSVVTVNAIQENQNLTMRNEDFVRSVTGVIVADNGNELLILVNDSVLRDESEIKVRFADKTVYKAVLKKKDGNIGMAVLSVPKTEIKDTTWSKIKVAELGNSNAMNPGETLIGVGNLFSYGKGVSYGVASSVNYTKALADGRYRLLVTDMPGSVSGNGILFDIDGKVVGMIHPNLYRGDGGGVLTAFGISSIKGEIELMSNAKDVPYIGIIGTVVTEEIAKAQNIPKGLYVEEVEVDSPAMKAGIQAGDVITDIGKKEVESLLVYQSTVLAQEAGKEVEIKGQRRGAENYVEIGFTVTVGVKE